MHCGENFTVIYCFDKQIIWSMTINGSMHARANALTGGASYISACLSVVFLHDK